MQVRHPPPPRGDIPQSHGASLRLIIQRSQRGDQPPFPPPSPLPLLHFACSPLGTLIVSPELLTGPGVSPELLTGPGGPAEGAAPARSQGVAA